MSKLPPRNILTSILQDAINDRKGMSDPAITQETADSIRSYEGLQKRLREKNRPMNDDDRSIMRQACIPARIWRESYLDCWIDTGDKSVILQARQDIERINRTEEALGGRIKTALDHAIENSESISIFDLIEA